MARRALRGVTSPGKVWFLYGAVCGFSVVVRGVSNGGTWIKILDLSNGGTWYSNLVLGIQIRYLVKACQA